jgi:hypothetical protein
MCGCKKDEKVFSAVCAKEQQAKLDAKECAEVYLCSYKCKQTDCDCMAACFKDKPKCHQVASAVDGCVVETCDIYCGPEDPEKKAKPAK